MCYNECSKSPCFLQTKGVNCMKFTFTTKKVDLSDSVKDYAEKKISKLDRYFKAEADAYVTFSVEKNNRCVVEVTIRGGNTLFRAQEENRDGNMRAAIDAAQEYIDRQIRKNKAKLDKQIHSAALDQYVMDYYNSEEEPEEYNVARVKRFPVKTMHVEEAILQMNMLDHQFYMFRNEESGEINVVYARRDGGYGLLEPDEEE